MKAVIVTDLDGDEVGRAVLMDDGSASVSGFPNVLQDAYVDYGILDMAGVVGSRGATVPTSRGEDFLKVLIADWQRPQTGVARETDV